MRFILFLQISLKNPLNAMFCGFFILSDIMELFAKRYSLYEINNHLPVQALEVVALIKDALKLYPSPFNSQTVKMTYNFPKSWELVAQMPFGGISTTPPPHLMSDLEEKLLILE